MISSNQLDQLDQEEIGNLQYPRNTIEGNMVRDILYGSRENVNFVHEVYRQAFLLSFSHSPAIKKVFKNQEFHNWVIWKTMVEYDSCFCPINNLLALHILVTSFPYIFGSFHAYLK